MGISGSPSETEYVGMSDEEEIARAGQQAEAMGLGEVLVDYSDDLTELGLST